jgi:hypothetical protein
MDLTDTKTIVENGKTDIQNRPYLVTLEEVVVSNLTGISGHFMNLLQGNFFVSKESFSKYSSFDKELFDILNEHYDVLDSDKILVLGSTIETRRQRILAHTNDDMESISESLTHKVVYETNIGISPDYIVICIQNLNGDKDAYKTKFNGKNSKYTFYDVPTNSTIGVVIAHVK